MATREEQIDGLRQLAQLLEDHEEISVPYCVRAAIYVHCADADDLLIKRKALGKCEKVFEADSVGFNHKVGDGGLILQLRLPRADVCEVIDTEEVWQEGYSIPGRYVTKKKYSCPDSIIGKISQVG
jgi:hypothetical protein